MPLRAVQVELYVQHVLEFVGLALVRIELPVVHVE